MMFEGRPSTGSSTRGVDFSQLGPFEELIAGLEGMREEILRLRVENQTLHERLRGSFVQDRPPIPALPPGWLEDDERSTDDGDTAPEKPKRKNLIIEVSADERSPEEEEEATADELASDRSSLPEARKEKRHSHRDHHHQLRHTATAAGISRTQRKVSKQERRRLWELLKLEPNAELVTDRDLFAALKPRILEEELSMDRVQHAMAEMNKIIGEAEKQGTLTPMATQRSEPVAMATISFDALAALVLDPSFHEENACRMDDDLGIVLNGLRMVSVDDVVESVTRGQEEAVPISTKDRYSFENILNILVVVAICVNMCSMGLEVDYLTSSILWFIIEAFCVTVYLVEFCYRVRTVGVREYFQGYGWQWNCLDSFVTCVSLIDVSFQAAERWPVSSFRGAKVSNVVQISVLMRVLRVVRVVRFARLMRSPLLADLANMLVGFIIGLPALLWVLVAFVFILYMVGLIFRLCFGPVPGELYMEQCGFADDLVDVDSKECPIHYLYGEEFFGTVSRSMFTSFRFMLGDYSTRGGKSIVVAFSYGYGVVFETMFVGWMIVVIFGIFNIITSIFVDSTISGLKTNDVKRKHARQYERRYVQNKLKAILERVYQLVEMGCCDTQRLRPGQRHSFFQSVSRKSLEISKPPGFEQKPYMKCCDMRSGVLELEHFVAVMSDPKIKELMADIDIDFQSPALIFDAFDANGNHTVSIEELASACMKLRGEPQKHDLVSAASSVKALHSKFDLLDLRLQQQARRLKIVENAERIPQDT